MSRQAFAEPDPWRILCLKRHLALGAVDGAFTSSPINDDERRAMNSKIPPATKNGRPTPSTYVTYLRIDELLDLQKPDDDASPSRRADLPDRASDVRAVVEGDRRVLRARLRAAGGGRPCWRAATAAPRGERTGRYPECAASTGTGRARRLPGHPQGAGRRQRRGLAGVPRDPARGAWTVGRL